MRYVVQFNKQYTSVEEFESRKENFKLIHEEIKRFNQEETTSVHGHNYMSDWTREEYQNMLGLRNMTIKRAERPSQPEHMLQQFAPTYPVSYDWRTYSKVNAVKNQGSCGSCYAFATTTVLESNYAISNGTLWNLSEQQVIDCS
jgi:C1A family cysteine protease